MGSLDNVQLPLQDSALVVHLLMVGLGRSLVELDDDVHHSAVMTAF